MHCVWLYVDDDCVLCCRENQEINPQMSAPPVPAVPSAQPVAPPVQPPPKVPPPPAAEPMHPGAQRNLNVRDALSYLDSVKTKYKYQPEVYNRFLDIMKDFKSQK